MFRTTPLPPAGLQRANQIVTDDVVLDDDGQMWRVHSVHHEHDVVTLTMRNVLGEHALRGMSASTWVRMAARPETDRERAARVIGRGFPWLVAGCLVGLVAAIAQAPAAGGQWAAIVLLWLVGAVRMVTTPEQDR
ncbi:hypothetical protein [Curtobacterium sp. Curtsp57]|uniref:hypothetical protein n=1 Tax=Curtobacterium sp. Curtsp57 TaxID=3243047 RepID=UPI0039B5ED42